MTNELRSILSTIQSGESPFASDGFTIQNLEAIEATLSELASAARARARVILHGDSSYRTEELNSACKRAAIRIPTIVDN